MAAAASDRADRAPDNAEQLRRRANRRLLGASILLLVAIVAVPMFLEREPPPLPDNVDVRIPPVEGTKFEPRLNDGKKAATAEKSAEIAAITEPVGAQAGATVASPPAGLVAPQPPATNNAVHAKPAATPDPVPSAPKEPPKAAAKDTPKAPEKAAEKPAAKAAEVTRKPGQLVVQVIAVRDPATAKQLYDKAKALKFPAYTEKIDVANGVVIRVRVGPYDTKAQAESARAKLAQAGFEAKVVTLQ